MAESNPGSWGDATAILREAGVEEDFGYYREFTEPDQKALLTLGMRIRAAWRANDADAFAECFAADGSLLMKDEQLTSREQIRSFMADLFAGSHRGAHVQGWPVAVAFLTGDAALFVTEGGIVAPGETGIAEHNLIRSTWVVARRAGGPELVSHQSSPIKG